MAKPSKVYWPKRQEQLLDQLEVDDYKLMQKMDRIYRKEYDHLEKEVTQFIAAYGEDNIVQYNKLMIDLDDTARTLLIEKVEDFTKKYPEYAHLVDVRKNIYKLNRLQGLQQSILVQQMEIGAIEQAELTKHLEEVYKTGNQSVLEFLGHGTTMSGYNKDLFERTINAKWVNAENFSDRIWSNRQKLSGYINEDLRTAFARGDNTQTILKKMRERFPNVERSNMERLIRTEGTYVFNEAQAQTWENSGVDEYTYSAVMDRHTSKICQALDGETFKWADREPGINFPPMHPNCRSSYILPEIDEDWLMDEMRKTNPGKFNENVASETTLYASNADSVKIEGKQGFYKGLNNAIETSLNHGITTGNECLTWIDLDGNEAFAPLYGTNNEVVFTQKLVDYLKHAPDNSIISIHNHPSSSSFSGADLRVLSRYSSIKQMRVVGHNGSKYYAEVGTGSRPNATDIATAYRNEVLSRQQKYQDKVNKGMNPSDAWYEHSHEAVKAVAKIFGWKYRRYKK